MIQDLTNRYYSGTYMRGGPGAWSLSRTNYPLQAIPLHHTAGWYGPVLGVNATAEQELAQLDSVALDHATRFGIGPGYNYFVFPSGRAYAVGKAGTHRAHTKWYNPKTMHYWNYDAMAVCAFGNYETEKPTPQLLDGIREVVEQIRSLPYAINSKLVVYPHKDVPSVDKNGKTVPQQTACCGKNLAPFAEELNTLKDESVDKAKIKRELDSMDAQLVSLRKQAVGIETSIVNIRKLIGD